MTSLHFSDAEMQCHCGCGQNGCKRELFDALEELRSAVGVSIAVDCAYRCPDHNAALAGASRSEHMEGIAADIKIQGMTAEQMYQAVRKVPAFQGIGVAVHQGYIHVDTRTSPARWCYDEDGKWCSWNLPATVDA